MRLSWSRPFSRLRTTLAPVTKETMVHRETRVNIILLTESSGQISRSWVRACSHRRPSPCFPTSMQVFTKALKLGFTSSQRLKYKISNKLTHNNA